jgi:predicted DNA-binding transcriptional regulator AlpA
MTTPLVSPDDRILSEEDAAAFCGFSKFTLRRYVAARRGPPFVRIYERRRSYRIRDLRQWIDARTETARP